MIELSRRQGALQPVLPVFALHLALVLPLLAWPTVALAEPGYSPSAGATVLTLVGMAVASAGLLATGALGWWLSGLLLARTRWARVVARTAVVGVTLAAGAVVLPLVLVFLRLATAGRTM